MIREIRESRNLTQRELAERAGFQPSTISHFETGKRRPSWENLLKLSAALEVSVDQIMGQTTTVGETANLQNVLGELSFKDLDLVGRFARMLLDRKTH